MESNNSLNITIRNNVNTNTSIFGNNSDIYTDTNNASNSINTENSTTGNGSTLLETKKSIDSKFFDDDIKIMQLSDRNNLLGTRLTSISKVNKNGKNNFNMVTHIMFNTINDITKKKTQHQVLDKSSLIDLFSKELVLDRYRIFYNKAIKIINKERGKEKNKNLIDLTSDEENNENCSNEDQHDRFVIAPSIRLILSGISEEMEANFDKISHLLDKSDPSNCISKIEKCKVGAGNRITYYNSYIFTFNNIDRARNISEELKIIAREKGFEVRIPHSELATSDIARHARIYSRDIPEMDYDSLNEHYDKSKFSWGCRVAEAIKSEYNFTAVFFNYKWKLFEIVFDNEEQKLLYLNGPKSNDEMDIENDFNPDKSETGVISVNDDDSAIYFSGKLHNITFHIPRDFYEIQLYSKNKIQWETILPILQKELLKFGDFLIHPFVSGDNIYCSFVDEDSALKCVSAGCIYPFNGIKVKFSTGTSLDGLFENYEVKRNNNSNVKELITKFQDLNSRMDRMEEKSHKILLGSLVATNIMMNKNNFKMITGIQRSSYVQENIQRTERKIEKLQDEIKSYRRKIRFLKNPEEIKIYTEDMEENRKEILKFEGKLKELDIERNNIFQELAQPIQFPSAEEINVSTPLLSQNLINSITFNPSKTNNLYKSPKGTKRIIENIQHLQRDEEGDVVMDNPINNSKDNGEISPKRRKK